MTIALSKTREQFPLSTKKILKKTLTSSIGWIVFFVFILLMSMAFVLPFTIPLSKSASSNIYSYYIMFIFVALGLLGLLIFLTYLYQKWYFDVYFYDLTADYIIIKKGPITPREITIPYERVQDVYVDQDIFDRLFGLFDVHLSSATISSGMEAHIDGVEQQAAEGLRGLLLKTVSEKITRAKNPIQGATPTPNVNG